MSALAPFVAFAVDWLGTFALHSTIALGGAWLVSLALGRRALAMQEVLLRTSLWLAPISATVQCALRGVWQPELVLTPGAVDLRALVLDAELASPSAAPALAAAAPWWTSIAWPELALAVAAAVASVGLGWLCLVHHRLRTVLRARRPETDARVLTTAAEVARSLGMQQSPHVSRSAAIATPIAFGLLRPEVCLPARVGELSHASLRAMLAHEVAHLRAADPAWMWGAVWLQALFAWQPLFVVVRRRWARLVELRCDAIAAEHATPTAVARCLLDVADWLRPGSEVSVAALGMAARPSALRERVEAALRGGSFRPARGGVSRALASVALGTLTLGAPAVATDPDGAGLAAAFAAFAADAVDAPANASSAPAAPRRHRAAMRGLLAALQTEHTSLLAEAEHVRALLHDVVPTRELAAAQAALTARLAALARMRERVEAALAPTDSPER